MFDRAQQLQELIEHTPASRPWIPPLRLQAPRSHCPHYMSTPWLPIALPGGIRP